MFKINKRQCDEFNSALECDAAWAMGAPEIRDAERAQGIRNMNPFRLAGLLFPPRIYIRLPETKTTSCDSAGRRYGDYFFLTLSLGHLHINLFPRHVRRVWASSYLARGLGSV